MADPALISLPHITYIIIKSSGTICPVWKILLLEGAVSDQTVHFEVMTKRSYAVIVKKFLDFI